MGRNLPGGRGGLHERQQRQHAIGGVLRENELFHAGTAENFFHSFKIHALLRDVLGLLVLLEEREEAVGFALGVADTGFPCRPAPGSPPRRRGRAPWDELVAVGFGFVDDAALVLAGAGDVLEGVADFLGGWTS